MTGVIDTTDHTRLTHVLMTGYGWKLTRAEFHCGTYVETWDGAGKYQILVYAQPEGAEQYLLVSRTGTGAAAEDYREFVEWVTELSRVE